MVSNQLDIKAGLTSILSSTTLSIFSFNKMFNNTDIADTQLSCSTLPLLCNYCRDVWDYTVQGLKSFKALAPNGFMVQYQPAICKDSQDAKTQKL